MLSLMLHLSQGSHHPKTLKAVSIYGIGMGSEERKEKWRPANEEVRRQISCGNPRLLERECQTSRQMQLASALCCYLEVARSG